MRLNEFLRIEEVEEAEGNLDQEISGLAYDSRKVEAGKVFFAIPGEQADGHRFIAEAVRRGAAAVVFSRPGNWPAAPASVRVKDSRRAMGLWAAHFFGQPSRKLKLVGVTGTNGKTTLTYLIESVFRAAGLTPGVIGTINYRYPGHEMPSHHTTPESLDIEELLAEMAQAGVKSVAMEVSSHALVQERVRGLDFDIGVFTNLSRDHLDYHRDMDDYFSAKSRLFTDYLKASAKPGKAAVIFAEDPRGQELIAKVREHGLTAWSYGIGAQWDVHPVGVSTDGAGARGTVRAREVEIEIESSLIGAANLQNILGAVAVGRALGLSADSIGRGIRDLKTVPGRLERVENPLGISILVDYAHTPDALEKVLGAVRPLTGRRVIAVFGCGGDRDRGKRPVMGEIAARLSDVVILTSDNPRTENPLAIIEEIEAGVKKTGMKKFRVAGFESQVDAIEAASGYCAEPDRRAAIGIAVRMARPGDLILIAGKGHEDYQILGATKIHFDDREVAREEARRRAGG
ncbi:MAG TPA: UDP-N-acetylmuramoyl-L-alanyl-D-glutamate--2,6-diaminopimelate ligase [Methylomirabilota bacterium]|jgi:UDP-N-acetylmuramoyl-L-alanyl-D-glutamate--2,6-diaminopimelate ligase|nr:UDP-N-acetylmuramoyl-L-alanyl-D-glutamate--2,6-diaminopimelate ligase [Methylomirabilota bacterium]